MASRVFAFRTLAALGLAGFALSAAPASAQAQVACGYQQYATPCGYVVVVPQNPCGGCGNRGLFTSTWVAPAPCGYNPCQQVVYQQQYQRPQYYQPAPQQYAPAPQQQYTDDDDDTNVGYESYRTRTHRNVQRVHRHDVTTQRRSATRQCGYVNGKWHCVGRVSQQQKPNATTRN